MVFTKTDLENATGSFKVENLIGEGGFGKVYRGRLRHADVAVKVLTDVSINVLYTMHTHCVCSNS